MTTRSSARHRKATRPLTPISHIAPATRRGLVVAASSGLALTMIASGANAASSTEVAASAGSLQQTAGLGALTADAREAVTVNDAIVTGDVVAPADLTDVSGVTVEAPPAEEPPAPPSSAMFPSPWPGHRFPDRSSPPSSRPLRSSRRPPDLRLSADDRPRNELLVRDLPTRICHKISDALKGGSASLKLT